MLKALLKGGDGKAPTPPEAKFDASSFPCIEEGAPLADSQALADELDQRLKLARGGSLAGSLPTRYLNSVRSPLMPPRLRRRRRPSRLPHEHEHALLARGHPAAVADLLCCTALCAMLPACVL